MYEIRKNCFNPGDAVLRYGGSIAELASLLQRAVRMDNEKLRRMGKAALAYSAQATWAQAAEITAAEFGLLLA